jgi:hypothetical protein
MPEATRTLNPLHFEDLEPHRFEDLVRQLIYGFRSWHSIEAVGRKGSDEGIDIRAVERAYRQDQGERLEEAELQEEENGEVAPIPVEDRVWIIQCKREQRMGPSRVQKVTEENLSGFEEPPDAYVLAAACDFSKSARDAFREVVVAYSLEDFYLWGKAELEDMLFRPRNDHLLFAYFGISLQVKRRSMKSEARARLTTKRKLVRALGEIRSVHFDPVLIRDPEDERYPEVKDPDAFLDDPSGWRYWEVLGHVPPEKLAIITKKSYAYFDSNSEEWDAFLESDDSWPPHPELVGIPTETLQSLRNRRSDYWSYWREEVPDHQQAWLLELRFIPYERIIAVDEIGDAHHEPPHLLVDYHSNGSPFEDRVVKVVQSNAGYANRIARVDDLSEIDYFPDDISSYKESEA